MFETKIVDGLVVSDKIERRAVMCIENGVDGPMKEVSVCVGVIVREQVKLSSVERNQSYPESRS